jgi:hypothetical protein
MATPLKLEEILSAVAPEIEAKKPSSFSLSSSVSDASDDDDDDGVSAVDNSSPVATQLAQTLKFPELDSSDADEPPCKRRRLGESAAEWIDAARRFRLVDFAAQPSAVRHAVVDLAAAIAASRGFTKED